LNTADDDATRLNRDALGQTGELVLYFLSEQNISPAPAPTQTALSEQALRRTKGKN
jgi:hypothetical protein